MGTVSDKLPVIAAIEDRDRADDERRREIHARCVTIERACRAIGFGAGEGYERVATLVARVAGRGVLRRTLAEIAEDKDVELSLRHTDRAIDELERFGLLTVSKLQVPAKKRGRPVIMYLLQLNWENAQSVIAEHAQWEASCLQKIEAKSQEIEASDLTASSRHEVGIDSASSRHDDGMNSASGRHLADHSYVNPKSQLPGPSPKGSSGRPDQICVRTFRAEEVAASAERLWRALEYGGKDGRTIWQVAAAFDAGLLSEHQVRDSSYIARRMANKNRIGYFRTVLAEHCDTDSEGLRKLLAQVRIEGGFPSERPQACRSGVSVSYQAVPKAVPTAATSDFVANERRDDLIRGLVTAARSGA